LDVYTLPVGVNNIIENGAGGKSKGPGDGVAANYVYGSKLIKTASAVEGGSGDTVHLRPRETVVDGITSGSRGRRPGAPRDGGPDAQGYAVVQLYGAAIY